MTARLLLAVTFAVLFAGPGDAADPTAHERARAEATRAYEFTASEPWKPAVADLASDDAGKRRDAAEFLLALLAVLDADRELPPYEGYDPAWKQPPHMKSARKLHDGTVEALGSAKHRAESVPVFEHLLAYPSREGGDDIREAAVAMLKGFDDDSIVAVLRSVLDPPHADSTVVLAAVDLVREHRLTALADAVSLSSQHCREDVRDRVVGTLSAIGAAEPERYDPQKALRLLDRDLRDFEAMVDAEIPPDAPWLIFSLSPESNLLSRSMRDTSGYGGIARDISGWLLGQTATEYEVLDSIGSRRSLPIHGTFTMASSLAAETDAPRDRLLLPESLLPGAWAYARGDLATAAALVLPLCASQQDRGVLRDRVRDQLANEVREHMVQAWAADADPEEAIRLGKLLARPLFAGYALQSVGAVLAAQIESIPRGLRDPEPIPRKFWEAQKASMNVRDQLAWLAFRLPTAAAVDASKARSPAQLDLLSVEWELKEMDFSMGDAVVLAPFLADDRFVPVSNFLGQERRAPKRVSTIVADAINRVAARDVVNMIELRALPAAEREARIQEIAALCREQATLSSNDLLLSVLADPVSSDTERRNAMGELARSGDDRVIPYLLEMANGDSNARSFALHNLYLVDSPAAVDGVRTLNNSSTDELSRFYASMILLRHGDRAQLEGFEYIRGFLESDTEGYRYVIAWDELESLGRPDAMAVLERALTKTEVREEIASGGLLAFKFFRSGNDEVLELLQARLGSDAPKRLRLEKGPTEVPEGHYVATKIGNWTGEVRHTWDNEPAEDCRKARAALSEWLAEQHALIKAGKPNVVTSASYSGCERPLPRMPKVPS